MLTQQRYEKILKLLKERGSITVTEVKELLDTSESTVRRDITALDKQGLLVKVFGGAVAAEQKLTTHEYTVEQKKSLNREEKDTIARYGASLIEEEDFIYLDAGTTTAKMIDYLEKSNASFVTNAVDHAKKLAARGMKVFLIGGELKSSTEAVVGSQAILTLQEYHFTKGFFGVNGVTKQNGCTTPDAGEAMVKRTAARQCQKCYVLCDHTKFGNTSSVTFASFEDVVFLTDRKIPEYEKYKNVITIQD